jgi:hypothetical protein
MTVDPAIIEAAARALAKCGFYDIEAIAAAKIMLAAVAPLIRAATLEEAAAEAEAYGTYGTEDWLGAAIAKVIRDLKEQP